MKIAFFAALLACVPMAASALSCRRPSVEASFTEVQKDSAQFVVVRGQLDFAQHQVQTNVKKTQRIKAHLNGASLSRKGFATAYRKQVTLELTCVGQWCGSAQSGSDVIAFVELVAQGNVISVGPCGGRLFAKPTPKMVRAVEQCFAGKDCTPSR